MARIAIRRPRSCCFVLSSLWQVNSGRFSLTRILIVDDHELVRRGVRSLLAARSDFEVCGEAVDGRDGVDKAQQLKPDVVVMDVGMPNLNGFDATRLIRNAFPGIGVLILSQDESPETVKEAFRAGALGYVAKANISEQLQNAVKAVSYGKEFVTERLNSGNHKMDPNQITPVQHAQPKLAAIVESSDDAIISKDLNGIISSWNTAAERIFGYSAQEAIGQPITIIIPPELHEEEAQILKRLRNGERIEHFETVRVTKAGKRINISLTVSPIKDSSGRVTGASKIARDITESRTIEKELREKQELLRAAFTQTYSFMAILSQDGTIVDANRAALEGTGFTRDEAIGNKLWDVWWRSLPEEREIAKTSVTTAHK